MKINKPLQKPLHLILFDLGDTLIYFDARMRSSVFQQAHQALLASLQVEGLAVGKDFLDDFCDRMEQYYRNREIEFIEVTTRFVLCNTLADWGLGHTPDETVRRALEAFHRVTQSHWIPEVEALPMLAKLKEMGYRMGLVSNAADDENTQALVDKAGIRPYMEAIISSAALGVRKPNPRIFQHILERLDVAPQHAAMVGDTLGADILGAGHAGLYAIWVTRRGDTPANHAHRDTIIPDAEVAGLEDLPELLQRLNSDL
jgi:HAD superfamily hydrolase (TIGR01662 family)